MGNEHLPALMAAFSVAMSARAGMLTDHAVEDMRVKAEEVLLRDHPAYPVIMTFATMYELARRDPAQLAALGDDLERGVRIALAPAPTLPFRADIDG
jgi:hypothetical protein